MKGSARYSPAGRGLLLGFIFAILVSHGTAASAQGMLGPMPGQETDGMKPTRVSVGAGAMIFPEYQGSSDYRALPLPMVQANWGNRASLGMAQGFQYNFFNHERWQASTFLRYMGGRNNSGALSDIERKDGGLASGGRLRLRLGPVSVSSTVQTPLSGDISGSQANLAATFMGMSPGSRWIYTVGPSITWTSDNRSNGLYGLNESDAQTLGVSPYEAESGISASRLTMTLTRVISKQQTATAIISMNYLQGDAANSPLIQDLGERRQAMGGVILSWHF
ncbi:outer membrane protein [Natronospira proteinivora]|uniref:Outer membrane protein n=1 Tax=Natronospira proteinivora TaxID=1807133 RepID=A0ABT1G890_9GAMM|nr:MipA/OmpV family protein [Natronospira proteinivora]MCP1727272.1 outer membrane protein [Natronospira proteinivora]